MRMNKLALACAVAAAFALPAQAAQRAYVKSTGSDANTATGCTLAAPCRGFTAAHSVVDPDGEIVALDAAGYGAVTITKSVTITANPGFFAGIAASTGNAITLATPGISVTLRGLQINGIGANVGISMTAGDRLNIENCVITNFVQHGVLVVDVAKARVLNSLIRNNGGAGVVFADTASAEVADSRMLNNFFPGILASGSGSPTRVNVSNSVLSSNGWGAVALTGTQVTVIRTYADNNNASGFYTDGGLIAVSYSSASHNVEYGLNNVSGAMGSYGNNLGIGNGLGATSGAVAGLPPG